MEFAPGEQERNFGKLLATFRAERDTSQLKLSLLADVSARHISFVETGRAQPSRSMVIRLAAALGLNLKERAALISAAGYVPASNTQRLSVQAISRMRDASLRWADLSAAFAIEMASDPAEAIASAASALHEIGLIQFYTGMLTPATLETPAVLTYSQIAFAPIGWMLHYANQQYLPIDPLVDAAARSHRAFFWSEVLTPHATLSHRVRRMIGEAADFGIGSGFVMPVRRADGRVHCISCVGGSIETSDPAVRVRARTVSIALLHSIDEFGLAQDANRIELKRGANEILKYILDGRSVDWLSDHYSLPRGEVENLVADACIQLGTSEPLEAAFRARRFGLL